MHVAVTHAEAQEFRAGRGSVPPVASQLTLVSRPTLRGGCTAALLLGAALLSACANDPPAIPDPGLRGSSALSHCDGSNGAEFYFPPDILLHRAFNLAGSAREDYATFLRKFREPSLYCGAVEGESYRLMRLARAGTPVSVRIVRTVSGASVTVAKLQAPTWNLPPGELVESSRHETSAADWDTLVEAIEAAGFWRLDTRVTTTMHDGDPFVVEGRRGSVYHVVERRSPENDSAFRMLGNRMLALAKVSEESVDAGAPGVMVRPDRPQPGAPRPPTPPRP